MVKKDMWIAVTALYLSEEELHEFTKRVEREYNEIYDISRRDRRHEKIKYRQYKFLHSTDTTSRNG